MRRINSIGSKNSFELSPIYTGHFRKPSRASAEPLTIEGMNAFVLRLMMRMPRGSWGGETMDTTACAQDSSPASISTIGEKLTITGNVTSKGELHGNGRVQGDVHCALLVLGENAQVEGSVVAQDVMVQRLKYRRPLTPPHLPWQPYWLGPSVGVCCNRRLPSMATSCTASFP